MQTFSIVKAPTPSATTAVLANKAMFGRLNPDICGYIAEEPDLIPLGRTLGGVNKQYLALSHFSLNPAVALKRMGCLNVDELRTASQYECGFLGPGASRNCLVPLGVVVNQGIPGLRKYDEAFKDGGRDGTYPHVLHLLPDARRFDDRLLIGPDLEGDGCMPVQYSVNRFEQLYAGSGYTREMLATGDGRMELYPVGLNLSNGDMLLAYAYKDLASVA
jgi:hypothetical protein